MQLHDFKQFSAVSITGPLLTEGNLVGQCNPRIEKRAFEEGWWVKL